MKNQNIKQINRDLLINRINILQNELGGVRALARHLKITPSVLSRIKRFNIIPTDSILKKLGIEKEVTVKFQLIEESKHHATIGRETARDTDVV